MKKHTFFLLSLLMTGLLFVACSMNQFDDLTFTDGNFPYGNNSLPEKANITIQELKAKYRDVYITSRDTYVEITEDLYIHGWVVSNDESGNVYKQMVIQDETGGIVIGINATGTYAYFPVGQEVVLSLKNLCFGGYRKLPQIGVAFNGSIGRMSESLFQKHVRLIGNVLPKAIHPLELNSSTWKSINLDSDVPLLVHLSNVEFRDAGKQFAPIDNKTEDRIVRVGNNTVTFRMSSYANFALDTIPSGKVNITGVLTRFNTTVQMLLRVREDIEIVEINNK